MPSFGFAKPETRTPPQPVPSPSIKCSLEWFSPELKPKSYHHLPHNYDSVRLSSRPRHRTRTIKAGRGKRSNTRTRPGVIQRTSSNDGPTLLRIGSQFAAVVSEPPLIDSTCSNNISSSSRDLRAGFADKCLPTRIKQARLYCALVHKTSQKIQVR
jgi:hypothetical protein